MGRGSCICDEADLQAMVAETSGPLTTTIRLCRGTQLDITNTLDVTDKNLHLECPKPWWFFFPSSQQCTLDGGGSTRLVEGSNSILRLTNLRLQQAQTMSIFAANSSPDGGAIQLVDSFLHLEKCDLRENVAPGGAGGAVHLMGGRLLVQDSVFLDNMAMDGAAIATGETETTTMSNTVFEDNTSGAGGTVIVLGGQTQVEDVKFIGNRMDGQGVRFRMHQA